MAEGANGAAVRKVYERWAEGDFASGVEPYDEKTELVMHSPLPDEGTYVGWEGIGGYTRQWLAPWDRITIEAVEVRERGEHVLVRVVQRAAGVASGAETEMRYWMVWTFDGDTAVRVQSIQDEADAIAAVGVEEGAA